MINCKYGSCVSKTINHKPSANLTLVTAFLALGVMISICFVPASSIASGSLSVERYKNSDQPGLELDQPAEKTTPQYSVLGLLSLKEAASAGDTEAQYALGQAYYDGTGVMQDRKIALEMWRKAAQNGHARAQANLGELYREGIVIPKDLEEAFKWDMKSAKNGHPTAQYNVGVCYKLGKGVDQDESEAFKWFYKAAQNGDPSGQFVLGLAYSNGEGVGKDEKRALYWINRSAAQGFQPAVAALTILTAARVWRVQPLRHTKY